MPPSDVLALTRDEAVTVLELADWDVDEAAGVARDPFGGHAYAIASPAQLARAVHLALKDAGAAKVPTRPTT
jgi:hypothetical protein